MATLRTISTLLVLGTLLLPPHWCCAFGGNSADESNGAVRACCAGHVVRPARVERVADKKPCCCAGNESNPDGDDRDARSRIGGRIPLDSHLCPYCLPRVAPNVEKAVFTFDGPMLPAVGYQLPTLCETSVAASFDFEAFVPISGDLLARHCRWNC